jgi:hypothetical protein
MKKIVFIFGILLCAVVSNAQEFSISAGSNWGIPLYYQFVSGGAGKSPKTGFNSQVEFIVENTKKVSWGVGLGFQNNRVEITPEYFGDDIERVPHIEKSNLLYLNSKIVFRKRNTSYLSLDPLIGIQLNETTLNSFDNQTGIGLAFSFVKKINLNENTFLKIEPKFTVFNIIPFEEMNMAERFTSIGINIGLGFKK